GDPQNRNLFLQVLEQGRRRYHFVVLGYVVMPEHVHLLLSEPERGNPSAVLQAIKQGSARRLLSRLRKAQPPQHRSLWIGPVGRGRIWQPRFYDFVVFSEKKRAEKLRYMHRNPVKRRTGSGAGPVGVEQLSSLCLWRSRTRARERATESGNASKKNLLIPAAGMPTLRNPRSVGQPHSW
ncbi:MAG TPA: transposase, partial [Terriglobales bacterium]|nr:transposase [Terriglobales bacterium]